MSATKTQTYTQKAWIGLAPVYIGEHKVYGKAVTTRGKGLLAEFWLDLNEGVMLLVEVFTGYTPLWGVETLAEPVVREVKDAD